MKIINRELSIISQRQGGITLSNPLGDEVVSGKKKQFYS